MASSFPTAPPPVALPAPRTPLLAGALSFLVPGLGLIYAGGYALAVVFFVLNQLGAPLMLAWVMLGGMPSQVRVLGILPFAIGVRALAAAVSVWWAKRTPQAAPTPVGVYAIFVVANLVLGMYLVPSMVSERIPVIQLSAPGNGFAAGDTLMMRKYGETAAPRPGQVAAYLLDPPDAGPTLTTGMVRQAYLGTVTGVEGERFTVDGLDASVPVADYAGEVLELLRRAPASK